MGKFQNRKKGNGLFWLFFLIFGAMILWGGWKMLGVQQKYADVDRSYQSLADQYVSNAAPSPEPSEPRPEEPSETEDTQTEAPSEPAESVLEEYAPITVDFDALRQDGPEIIGWLYCEDTPINYPIAHHEDNDYYLHRLPDGTENFAGTIFLECTNKGDFSDWNNILYGHHMKNYSMFGSLTRYREQYYANKHPVLYLLTPEGDYKIHVIGGYTTVSTSDSYAIPSDLSGRDVLVERAVENSQFIPTYQAEPGRRIITLSTCSYEYDEARFLLIGTLTPLLSRE